MYWPHAVNAIVTLDAVLPRVTVTCSVPVSNFGRTVQAALK